MEVIEIGEDCSKIIRFNGQKKDFLKWQVAFQSVLCLHGLSEALLDKGGEPNLPTKDKVPTTGTDDEKEKVRLALERNRRATSALILAVIDVPTSYGIVTGTINSDWPYGVAWKAWKLLREHYAYDRSELRKELNTISMKEDEDPSALIDRLYDIKNRFNLTGHFLDDKDLISQCFIAAPPKYRDVLIDESHRQGTELTLAHLAKAMRAYKRMEDLRHIR